MYRFALGRLTPNKFDFVLTNIFLSMLESPVGFIISIEALSNFESKRVNLLLPKLGGLENTKLPEMKLANCILTTPLVALSPIMI